MKCIIKMPKFALTTRKSLLESAERDGRRSHRANHRNRDPRPAKKEHVHFLRLQFTDITASSRTSRCGQPVREGLDGSDHVRRVSIEELHPDRGVGHAAGAGSRDLPVFPWGVGSRQGRPPVCDIATPDGATFDGCPRSALKRTVARAAALGYRMMAGPEAEFFLFRRTPTAARLARPTTPAATST